MKKTAGKASNEQNAQAVLKKKGNGSSNVAAQQKAQDTPTHSPKNQGIVSYCNETALCLWFFIFSASTGKIL